MTATLNPTTELLSHDDFRAALEDAIKGREAKNASFSKAWANGELEREHFARWAENHYHYVGPFADYLGIHLRQHARTTPPTPRTSSSRTCTRRSCPTSATPIC